MDTLLDWRIIIILIFSLLGLIEIIYRWTSFSNWFNLIITDPLFYIFCVQS